MFALSFLIVTTIIGAGFATGAELMAFFKNSSMPPVVIALFVAVFLLLIMCAAFLAAERSDGNGRMKKAVFNILYFVFYVVMIAGTAELGGHTLAISAVVLCIAIVSFGFDNILFINTLIAAAIFAVLLWVGGTNASTSALPAVGSDGLGKTIFSALLYAGLNSCMMEELFRTARKKFSAGEIFLSALFAVCIISFFVMLLLTAIFAKNASGTALPVLALNSGLVTAAVVFFAILTSMYVALFNLLGENKKEPKNKLFFLVSVSLAAYICSLFGFTEVVETVYPLVGIGMVFYTAYIIISSLVLKKKKNCFLPTCSHIRGR